MPPFPFVILIEISCLIFGILSLHKGSGKWTYFKWILFLTVLKESFAYSMIAFLHFKSNHWFHNIFLPVDFIIINCILYYSCKKYFNCKALIIGGSVVFLIFYFYESFSNGFLEYSVITSDVSSVYFVFICCLYYYYLLKQDTYINLLKDPVFWIITGLFFFYFGRTACNLFFTYLVAINKDSIKPARYIIFIFLNLILYCFWSNAFLCRYRQTVLS